MSCSNVVPMGRLYYRKVVSSIRVYVMVESCEYVVLNHWLNFY
jgi:hypothetical protein